MRKLSFSLIGVAAIIAAGIVNANLFSQSSESDILLSNLEALSGEHYLNGVQRGYERTLVWIPDSMTADGSVGTGGVGVGGSMTYRGILCCTPCTPPPPSEMSGCDFDMENSDCINWVVYT
ncbi:MAG: hypothetical protein LBG15_04980 [Dysgonamonadaceae bacterium]|jgi:hypothetical protein|nr:hypothetical protein [Dysgonamonadaceae bacterium]